MLRQLYGPGMAKSKLADAFAYITSAEPDSVRNIEEMSKRIAQTDKFDGSCRLAVLVTSTAAL